jgi:hypothetical protein
VFSHCGELWKLQPDFPASVQRVSCLELILGEEKALFREDSRVPRFVSEETLNGKLEKSVEDSQNSVDFEEGCLETRAREDAINSFSSGRMLVQKEKD